METRREAWGAKVAAPTKEANYATAAGGTLNSPRGAGGFSGGREVADGKGVP